jgi:thiosulfate reductase/polysulfide reductase chain A
MKETKRAVCEMCHSRCRVAVTSENGHLAGIEEDRTDPRVDQLLPPTRACLRLKGAMDWMKHPGRVNYPLKRSGERGDGKWQRISWEQAFDEVAGKLNNIRDKYGAESLTMTNGTGRVLSMMPLLEGFLNAFGSPNYVGQAKICYGPNNSACAAMFGRVHRHRMVLTLERDDDEKIATKCVLMIGMDASQALHRFWKSIREAKKEGVKIIVVDPRKTGTAELADIWLQLRPGTDTGLLMSMINVIIQEKLYDKEFVDNWCYGFDKLAERATEYPPEKMAQVTWIPPEKIRETARIYATNRPALSLQGMGLEHLQDCMESIHARLILAAITGNIDIKGGHYIPEPVKNINVPPVVQALSKEQQQKQIGSDRFKQIAWPGFDLLAEYSKKVWGKAPDGSLSVAHNPSVYRAMLTGEPYPVRAAITVISNPILTQGNSKLVYKALKSLDLYVVSDYWMTPSAEIADYVLPAASWMERPFFSTLSADDGLVGGEKALPSTLPGEYDHRDDYSIIRGLGIRLGQEKYWPWENLEELFDYQLEPRNITFKEFMANGGYDFPEPVYKKHEKVGFGTPTGKVELYSVILEKLGYDALPAYRESFENPVSTPDLAKKFPLMLITGGRFQPMFHSEHRQIEVVRRRHPHPLVQIHPDKGRELGISDGDWVWIETLRGKIRMKCQLFNGIDRRVVHCEHGWWFPELPGEEPWLHGVWESNVNVLTDDDPEHCNPISGGWPLKTALCRVYKATAY